MAPRTTKTYSDKACRVCLEEGYYDLAVFFTGSFGKRFNLVEALTAIADIKLKKHDGLPHYLCKKCHDVLLKAHAFKLQAEDTDRRLHNLPNSVTIVIKDETKLPSEMKQIKFDNIESIKSQLCPMKTENSFETYEVKIEPLNEFPLEAIDSYDKKELTICNTTIKKVNSTKVPSSSGFEDINDRFEDDDDFFWGDDHSEDEYLPPPVAKKSKHRKKHSKGIVCDIKIQNAEPLTESIGKAQIKKEKEPFKVNLKTVKTATTKAVGIKTRDYGRVVHNLNIPIEKTEPWDSTMTSPKNPEPGLCPECGENVENLRKHILTHHRVIKKVEVQPKEREICPVCGLMFMHLEKHLKKHDEDKNTEKLKCDHCSKDFKTKNSLTYHLALHMDLVVKNYICDVCEASFAKKGSLERHKLIHKGERPFDCGVCGRKFLLKQQLKIHMNTHTGTKPWQCPMCDRCFSTKTIMLTHKRVHTGEKPYTCQICNMAFSYKVNLNNHAEKYHGFTLRFTQIHTINEELIDHQHEIINKARFAVYKDRIAARMCQADDKNFKNRRRKDEFSYI